MFKYWSKFRRVSITYPKLGVLELVIPGFQHYDDGKIELPGTPDIVIGKSYLELT